MSAAEPLLAGLPFVYDDGGRADSGFSVANDAGDCVARAIAIAHELPYRDVYDALAERSAAKGGRRSARDGVLSKVYKPYLVDLGFAWTPTMSIGSGCTHHLRAGEVPAMGRFVVRLSDRLRPRPLTAASLSTPTPRSTAP